MSIWITYLIIAATLLVSELVYFKVADHVTHPDDIMDYYVSGDVAPLGRLGYGY